MNRSTAAAGRALAEAGLRVTLDAEFGALTTYGVGGRAGVRVDVSDEAEMKAAGGCLAGHPDVEVFVLGNGSNTLVVDQGFDGIVVRCVADQSGGEPDLSVAADSTVRVPPWMLLPVLARRSVAAGLTGLEWAVGVPGTVGGAVRMNAGGHGAEIVDSLVSVRVVSLRTGREIDVSADDLGLHFRGSALAATHAVTGAVLRVARRDEGDTSDALGDIVAWRREHQPGGRNAGSVFVNPGSGEESAGALIDGAGLRGATVGEASVSTKHANFIQAGPGATAADVVGLMTLVQETVARRSGIRLRSEVCLVGFSPDVAARFAGESHRDPHVARATARLCERLGESHE